MNKKTAMVLINSKLKNQKLNNSNTHWSDVIKYGKAFGWWLNIPFHKFHDGFYMILNDPENKKVKFFKVPGEAILNPTQRFRNKENTADIFISLNDIQNLTDIQSNSTNFQFKNYLVTDYSW